MKICWKHRSHRNDWDVNTSAIKCHGLYFTGTAQWGWKSHHRHISSEYQDCQTRNTFWYTTFIMAGITGIPLIFKGYWYGLPPLLRPKFGKLSTPGRSFKQPTLDLNTSHVRDHSSFENPVWKTLPTPDHFYFLITFWTCRTVLDRMSWSTLYYSSSALQCPLNHLHPWQKKGWFWSCLYIPFYGHKVYLTNGRCQ